MFQLRHKDFGVYQGDFLGMQFWYPTSKAPQRGICRFDTKEEAQKYIDVLCSDKCFSPEIFIGKLVIENYDESLNNDCIYYRNIMMQTGGMIYHAV